MHGRVHAYLCVCVCVFYGGSGCQTAAELDAMYVVTDIMTLVRVDLVLAPEATNSWQVSCYYTSSRHQHNNGCYYFGN